MGVRRESSILNRSLNVQTSQFIVFNDKKKDKRFQVMFGATQAQSQPARAQLLVQVNIQLS